MRPSYIAPAARFIVLPGLQQRPGQLVGDDRDLGVACQLVQEAGMVVVMVGQEQGAHAVHGDAHFGQVLAVDRVIVPVPASTCK